MIRSAYVFQHPGDISGFFDSFMGGFFLVKGIPLAAQLTFLFAVPAAALCALVERVTGRRLWGYVSGAASLIVFTLFCLFCLQPWDELFVNLRHAKHFAEGGPFSFNRWERIEATVDFLPYLWIGWLGRLGLPILETAFFHSYLGGLLCLWAVRRLVIRWGFSAYRHGVTFALALFPPLAFNSAHGFATTLFSAIILLAITSLFFSGSALIGLGALAILPLIRPEGLWLTWLLGAYYCLRERASFRRGLATGVALSLPTALLSLWRWWYFGSAVPVPLLFKTSVGNFFYSVIGLRNLAADLIAGGTALALLLLGVALWVRRVEGGESGYPDWLERSLGPLVCLCLFVVPYYVSGGDWFPSYWGRYCLPLALLAIPVGWAAFVTLMPRTWRLQSIGVALSLLGFQALWPISSAAKAFEAIFTHRRLMAKILDKKTGRGHYRIQHLSQLGRHLKATTPPHSVIGSSEVATIMYFAERETLDLLGIANPQIARSPLRQTPPLWRPFPRESELPYLIFKRLQGGIVRERKPEILYAFDFLVRDLIEGLPFEEVGEKELSVAIRRWEYNLKGLIDVLYGGTDEILRMGYVPVIVKYRNAFCGMYFVSDTALADHLDRLRAAGFSGGLVEMASKS